MKELTIKEIKAELDIREGTYTHTFRLFNPQEYHLGDTYDETEQSFVNLTLHERFQHIIDTGVHEDIHVALKREFENLPMDVEHEIIKRLFWAMDDMIIL